MNKENPMICECGKVLEGIGTVISWASDGFVYCVPCRITKDEELRKERELRRAKNKEEYEKRNKKKV